MSNGGEHTPERCVHAPDGPDWAGLWELPTPKPDYAALVEGARRRVNDAVPAWGWCMYPTLSRRYLDTPFAEETSWTISEPYCGSGVWCGDGECAGACGSEVIRTGSEGCEEDWMSAPVAVFVSAAPDDVRALADAVEALLKDRDSWKRLWERLDSTSEKHYENLIQDRMDAEAERDALRTQLDSMTVEWGTAAVAGDDRTVHRDVWDSEDAARNARGYGESVVTRLVSSWTVAEGDDQ